MNTQMTAAQLVMMTLKKWGGTPVSKSRSHFTRWRQWFYGSCETSDAFDVRKRA